MTDRDFNKKDGQWFPVMNELAEKLITYELTKIEHRVMWMFFRFCYGYNESTCALRWTDMLDITGLPPSSLAKGLKGLKRRNILLTTQTESKTYVTYKINSKLSSWKSDYSTNVKSTNVEQSLHKRRVITPHLENVPYKDINTKNNSVVSKIEIPEWLDKDTWVEFKKYRKSGKGKFTDYAQKLALSKLEKLRADGNDPNDVLRQSILNGWSGLFPIRKEVREEAIVRQKADKKLEEYKRIMSL